MIMTYTEHCNVRKDKEKEQINYCKDIRQPIRTRKITPYRPVEGLSTMPCSVRRPITKNIAKDINICVFFLKIVLMLVCQEDR